MMLICHRATINATSSPLLRLPAEIRSHILDLIFKDNIIRVHPNVVYIDSRQHAYYKLSNCQCPTKYERYSSRVWVREAGWEDKPKFMYGCEECQSNYGSSPAAQVKLSLQVLQVCRQIYHEAALKPFSNSVFIYECDNGAKGRGLQAFVNALVPAQARAISQLQLTGSLEEVLTSAILPKMKGLRHLDLYYDLWFHHLNVTLERLKAVEREWSDKAVAKLGLQSLRVEIGLWIDTERIWTDPAELTLRDAQEIETCLECMELELLERLG